MKRILFILSLFACYVADSQTIYYPSDPESLFVPVQIMGSVRKVYVSELVKNRISKTKYTTDSTALRGLINTNTTSLSAKLNIADSAAMLANYRVAVIANTANIAANTAALATAAQYNFTGLSNWDLLRYNATTSKLENYKSTYNSSSALKMLVRDTVTGQVYHQAIPTGTAGILPTYTTDALAASGGVNNYFNTADNRVHYLAGTTWYRLAVQDSVLGLTTYSQGWEGVTPPAAPSDWTFSTGAVTTSTNPITGTKALTSTTTGVETAMYNTTETGSGVTVSTTWAVYTSAGPEVILVARASTKVWSTMACYTADLVLGNPSGGIGIGKRTGGSYSIISGARIGQGAAVWTVNGIYKVTLTISGTSSTVLTATVKRVSDNFYLNSSGAWQNTVATAVTYTDSSSPITAAGFDGMALLLASGATGATSLTSDDFSITQ